MNISQISEYWKDKNIVYKNNLPDSLNIQARSLLESIGLPIISKKSAILFSPNDKLKIRNHNNHFYLFLGSPNHRISDSLSILLDLSEFKIHLYRKYYLGNLSPEPISYMNKTLLTFLMFCTRIDQFSKYILSMKDTSVKSSIDKVKLSNESMLLKDKLKELDPLAFKTDNSFWNDSFIEIDQIIASLDDPRISGPIDVGMIV